MFSYACPHCAHFQPYADQLKKSLPAGAVFDYMPAVFNPSWEPYARAYYTAESLGVLDKTHQALFDALHRDHLPMRTIDDLATFYAQHGVDKAKFLATSGSFEVESKLSARADRQGRRRRRHAEHRRQRQVPRHGRIGRRLSAADRARRLARAARARREIETREEEEIAATLPSMPQRPPTSGRLRRAGRRPLASRAMKHPAPAAAERPARRRDSACSF